MSNQSQQARWLVKLDGSSRDVEAVKRNFSAKVLAIEDIGDERFLSAPRFAGCESARDVMAEAAELLANVNVAMSITNRLYSGIYARKRPPPHNCRSPADSEAGGVISG